MARATVGGLRPGTAATGSPATSGIAIVTGTGAGAGRAIALALAGAGYGILAADIDGDSAAACAAQARSYGVPAQAVRADLRDPLYLERIVAVGPASRPWHGLGGVSVRRPTAHLVRTVPFALWHGFRRANERSPR